MTSLNGNRYTITVVDSTRFTLNGVNSSLWSSWTSGGTIRQCLAPNCELVVTSASHGLAAGQYAYLTGIAGTLGTQLNNQSRLVGTVTSTTFVLSGTNGPTFNTYSSGGTSYCVTVGCEYYRFMNASLPSTAAVLPVSNCVSERIGASAYTDASPAGAPLGWNYVSTQNPCPTASIVPLTSDKNLLTSQISTYQAAGSTAGQIGIAGGWYMLSPSFASLWPIASRPAPYETEDLIKVAVIMTDGEFNTGYCNHTISRDWYALTSAANRSGCNATNGDPSVQAEQLCEAMKAAGIVIYTVGFDLNEGRALEVLANCATDPSYFHVAADGADLQVAFRAIAADITQLRIAE
jgi:hypothetical protein